VAEFVILRNGIIETYCNYNDIPEKFDNVIKFVPDYSEGPHTHEEHNELHLWNDRLKQLLKRETNASSN
jgi:hypothetical protein